MAWCRQAASHYLSQCWPRFMSPHGVTRPQWVNSQLRTTDTQRRSMCFCPTALFLPLSDCCLVSHHGDILFLLVSHHNDGWNHHLVYRYSRTRFVFARDALSFIRIITECIPRLVKPCFVVSGQYFGKMISTVTWLCYDSPTSFG